MRQRVNKLKDDTAEEVERLMYLKMELEKINQEVILKKRWVLPS